MLRPWIQTARPADWRGHLAWFCSLLLTLVFLLVAVVGRLPESWMEMFDPHVWLLRTGLAVLVLWIGRALSLVAYALIGASPVVFWGKLHLRVRGRSVRLRRDEIRSLAVERRPFPTGETVVVEDKRRRRYDVCPLHWRGAERVYRRLDRWLANG